MNYKLKMVEILKQTADRLKCETIRYQWGHMGQCNVGHLVQTMTGMEDVDIVKSIDFEMNEWSEHAQTYCSHTGHKVDDIFETMRKYGFSSDDVIHLENLSDKKVLGNLPGGFRYLRRNDKKDVIAYLSSLAEIYSKAS